eukprot:jgi/Mesvir1/28033/Mv04639-RA.1
MKGLDDRISISPKGAIPRFGLGTYKIADEEAPESVTEAIKLGYRHLDCASDYGNEEEVGVAIEKSIGAGLVKREDLFVTSKLWNTYHAKDHVRPACERSIRDLRVKYLDLYLMHFPISLKYVPFDERYPAKWEHDRLKRKPDGVEYEPITIRETWEAMEKLVDAGLVKAIGVANFNCALLMDLLKYARIKPAVNQVELHPWLSQPMLVDYCKANGIVVTAYSPLGGAYSPEMIDQPQTLSLLADPVLNRLAGKHGKSAAQVALRWNLQRGVAVIVKSSKGERLVDNAAAFEFVLPPEDMREIDGLNKPLRLNDPGRKTYADCPIFA